MSVRLRTAVVIGTVFLAVLLVGGRLSFGVLVAAMAALGALEYWRISQPVSAPAETFFVAGWAAVIALGFLCASPAVPVGLLSLGVLIYAGSWIAGRGPREETLSRWGSALGSWVFVAYFLGHAVWVRKFGVSSVLYLTAVVWVGDSAAYYVGTKIGSRPLAPSVSPKKTVEGAVASLVAATAAAGVCGFVLPVPHPFWASLLLGVVLNCAAQLGDLAESLIKRCGGVKDSGTLFPGHGGVLDRIDGFLPALPIYVAFLTLFGA